MAFAPDCPMCLKTEITTLRGRVAYLEEELRLRDRTAVDVLRRAGAAQADADDKFVTFRDRRKTQRRTRPTMTGLHYDGQRTWGDNYSFGNPERRVADRRKR